ncbi:glycoside hydrolase family 15 protein [Acidianus brierleyi]|uniref:Glycoside hydrolase family 15 protein n=1 Tax=Acidianus brierleyi TaxID=41673 RepID=A0A2U9IDL5_9CREN|nr:glycoside hydrolase family 15 protein [Acidianus brierleyi]AWR94133.1 glycoside hydrolase family 15 protein [Acidianus brierleyi]
MTRYAILGNGQLTILADKNYAIRELYFPLSTENHMQMGRIGIWVNGKFSWLHDLSPKIEYEEDSLSVKVNSEFQGVKLAIKDSVDMAYPILTREVNISSKDDVVVFFAWDFNILGNEAGDTAFYDPFTDSIIHYKRDRWFLFSCNVPTYQYATGYKEVMGYQGTWKDCEDGVLSMNPIAQGAVDSAMSVKVKNKTFYCWLSASRDYDSVRKLHEYIQRKTPKTLIERTDNYWKAWLFKARNYEKEIRRSMLIIAAHWQNNGAIPASLDTDIMRFNKDTYNYVWHRDAAFSSIAMSLMGYQDFSRMLFIFSKPLLYRGFLFQKYTADGHWGSTWHPWTSGYIPIQEDETALTLYSAWVHFSLFRDVDFIKQFYRPSIKTAADFLAEYRDEKTGLPMPSYDLWEERLGVHFFTSAAVYAGLTAAAKFAEFFGEDNYKEKYLNAAEEIKKGLDMFFVGDHFARSLNDKTVDSSTLLGSMLALDKDDKRVSINRKTVEEKLLVNGGIARYENDWYLKEDNKPNAWFITTLWLAQHYVFEGNMENAIKYLNWVLTNSLSTGIIPEQISPTGNYPSVSPLVWSHAELIRTFYYIKNGFNRFI